MSHAVLVASHLSISFMYFVDDRDKARFKDTEFVSESSVESQTDILRTARLSYMIT